MDLTGGSFCQDKVRKKICWNVWDVQQIFLDQDQDQDQNWTGTGTEQDRDKDLDCD